MQKRNCWPSFTIDFGFPKHCTLLTYVKAHLGFPICNQMKLPWRMIFVRLTQGKLYNQKRQWYTYLPTYLPLSLPNRWRWSLIERVCQKCSIHFFYLEISICSVLFGSVVHRQAQAQLSPSKTFVISATYFYSSTKFEKLSTAKQMNDELISCRFLFVRLFFQG